MRDTIDMAREAGFPFNKYGLLQGDDDGEIDADKMFKAFEALVRADERGRMCEQLKECSSEKPTSNETNRSAVLGEGGQAN
jgi:hypothetical protein